MSYRVVLDLGRGNVLLPRIDLSDQTSTRSVRDFILMQLAAFLVSACTDSLMQRRSSELDLRRSTPPARYGGELHHR